MNALKSIREDYYSVFSDLERTNFLGEGRDMEARDSQHGGRHRA